MYFGRIQQGQNSHRHLPYHIAWRMSSTMCAGSLVATQLKPFYIHAVFIRFNWITFSIFHIIAWPCAKRHGAFPYKKRSVKRGDPCALALVRCGAGGRGYDGIQQPFQKRQPFENVKRNRRTLLEYFPLFSAISIPAAPRAPFPISSTLLYFTFVIPFCDCIVWFSRGNDERCKRFLYNTKAIYGNRKAQPLVVEPNVELGAAGRESSQKSWKRMIPEESKETDTILEGSIWLSVPGPGHTGNFIHNHGSSSTHSKWQFASQTDHQNSGF